MMNLESMGFKKSATAIAVSCALMASSGGVLAVVPPSSIFDDIAKGVPLKKVIQNTKPPSLLDGLRSPVQLKKVPEGERKYLDETPFKPVPVQLIPADLQEKLARLGAQEAVVFDADSDDDWDTPTQHQRLESANSQVKVNAVLAEREKVQQRQTVEAEKRQQPLQPQQPRQSQQAEQAPQVSFEDWLIKRRTIVDPDDVDSPRADKANLAAQLAAAPPPQRTQFKEGLKLLSAGFKPRSETPQAIAPVDDSSRSLSLTKTAGPAPAPPLPPLQSPQDKLKAQRPPVVGEGGSATATEPATETPVGPTPWPLPPHMAVPVPQDPPPAAPPRPAEADSTPAPAPVATAARRLSLDLKNEIQARMAPQPVPVPEPVPAETAPAAATQASTPASSAPTRKRQRTADLTIDTHTRYAFDGKMGRAAKLIKKGRGTLVLNHAGEMRNGVHLKQGRIELGHAQGLGAGSLLMDDGSAIDLAADGMTVANDIHMTGSDDPEINTGDHHQTWAGAISGAGFLTKQGAGSLTLTSVANSYSGLTEVAQGTLQAGAVNTFSAASVHNVAADATLNLAGFDQAIAGLNNRGTVQFGAAPAAPGTVLTVTGPYVGQGGELAIAANAIESDRLLLSGASAVASGSTMVRINNVGDLGAATTGNGIEVIASENGARLEPEAFSLAGGHVDAGAYAYRLHQTDQGASLQSSYRAEVPLLAALPAQLRQAEMSMLGNRHQRLGDTPAGAGNDRRAWGRLLRTEPSIRQQGTVSPQSSGHFTGFQTGLDLYAGQQANAGFYVGQLRGDMRVKGRTSGAVDEHVGSNRLHGRYLGLYASWLADTGMYADTVLQWADHRSHSHTQDSHAATKGRSRLASLEVGQPFGIDSRWQIEPQAQLVYRQLRLDDTVLSHAAVQHKTPSDWTLRVGARIRGSFATSAGTLQPYGSVNVSKARSATDVARFVAPAATTDIQTRGGHTSTALAAGATLQVNQRTSFYGELSQQWANGGSARVGSGLQASAGVKLRW